MKTVSFVSNLSMPLIILLIIIYGLKEKSMVFDNFIEGAKEGLKIMFNILPTLVGLFVAIGALRSSRYFRFYYKYYWSNVKKNIFPN